MASSVRLLAALRASVLGLAAGVRGQGRRVTLLGWVAAALVCATATSPPRPPPVSSPGPCWGRYRRGDGRREGRRDQADRPHPSEQ